MNAEIPYKFNIVNCEKINSQFNFGKWKPHLIYHRKMIYCLCKTIHSERLVPPVEIFPEFFFSANVYGCRETYNPFVHQLCRLVSEQQGIGFFTLMHIFSFF